MGRDPGSSLALIVPTYNGVAFVEEALRSVLKQTRLPQEVVVVDDASTDGTAEAVERLARGWKLSVRVLRMPTNSGGPARPLNHALAEVRADLVAVLDQDDVLCPQHLERLGGLLDAHPSAALAFASCGMWWDRNPMSLPGAAFRRLAGGQPPTLLWRLASAGRAVPGGRLLNGLEAARLLVSRGDFVIGYPGFIFRRSLWEAKGGLDEGLRIGSDYDLLCWLCLRGDAAYAPEHLYRRRSHGANLSGMGISGAVEGLRVLRRYLDQVSNGADSEFWEALRRHYLRVTTHLGWLGRGDEAWTLLRDATRAWGPGPGAAMALARLLATVATVRLGGGPARERPGELEEFRDHLSAVRTLLDKHPRHGRRGR